MDAATRIKTLRLHMGMSQQAFADHVGISRGYLSQVEAGSKTPSYNCVMAIIGKTDVSADWLLKGTGPMFRDEGNDDDAIQTALNDRMVRNIIEMLGDMDEARRREICAHVEEKKLLMDLLKEKSS